MDLICRTCLKMSKERYNMFEYSRNNRFISELITECTSIQIRKDDGLAINICHNCIEKVNSACNFKTMAIESDIKIRYLYQTTMEKVQKDTVFSMEELPISESKKFCDTSNSENYIPIAPEDNKYPLDLRNEQTKNEDIGEKAKWDVNEGDFKILENSPLDVTFGHCEGKSNRKEKLSEKDSPKKVDPRPKLSDTNLLNELVVKKDWNTSRNVNEKQVELLDNPDYKKIMKMGLSKKEKSILPVFCQDCNKTFTFRYFVGIHAHFHTGNLPFKCDKCEMRFPKRPILKQHLRTHIQTRDFACDQCGKTFSSIYLVKLHKVMHTTERPYKCETCSKSFKFPFSLQKHMQIHSREINHVCEVCGKTFTHLSGLKTHKIMHNTGTESFICKLCGRKYASKRSLDVHRRLHSSERRHVCSVCGKSFKIKAVLQRHILIHTGEKPYPCDVCGKNFRQRSCLTLHMRIHTGESPYPCEKCASAFKYKHHLVNHIKIHHKVAIEQKCDK